MKTSRKRRSRKGGSRQKRLSLFDAREATNGLSIPGYSALTIDASPAKGAAIRLIDLEDLDQPGGSQRMLTKAVLDLFCGSLAPNRMNSIDIYLVQYTGTFASTITNIGVSDTDEAVLVTSSGATACKYRKLKSSSLRVVPAGATDGYFVGQSQVKINLMPIWQQIEKICGEQTGMSLLPSQKFAIVVIFRSSTAADQLRIFYNLLREFRTRPSESYGL